MIIVLSRKKFGFGQGKLSRSWSRRSKGFKQ